MVWLGWEPSGSGDGRNLQNDSSGGLQRHETGGIRSRGAGGAPKKRRNAVPQAAAQGVEWKPDTT